MNIEAQEMLQGILSKEPAALTDADITFLRARRSYLSEEHLAVYAEILGEESVSGETTAESAEQPRARRSRKAAEQPEA
jgi:hypothetical protein